MAQLPPVGQGLLIIEASRSRITTHHSPLDEWSARRRDLYLTIHKRHKKQTSMPPTGFEPTIQTSEWPPTHALDRVATGIGSHIMWMINSKEIRQWSDDKFVQILVAKTELAM